MPRMETILRVFVASPKDLAEERDILESVIQELNLTWSKTFEVRLEMVRWETHTYPSVGADAQAVINQQIEDDYDIFIGLMWTRFGTSTGRAGSGTEEEFARAYRKHQEGPDQVRIMFYFKDAPISPSDLDPDQLASIKRFKQELGEKGTYHWTFTSRDEFTQLLRMHLGRQVQEWRKSWGIEPKVDLNTHTIESFTSLEEDAKIEAYAEDVEEGFLDLFESGQEGFQAMGEALGRMTSALQDLNTKVNAGADELNQMRSPNGNIDIKQAKRVTNRVAEALSNFAALMEVDVPIFANSSSSGIEAFSRAFTLTKDVGSQDKESAEGARDNIRQLRSSLLGAKGQMLSFQNSIAEIPRATTMFNRARKRALSILNTLDEEFTTASNLTSEMEKVLDQILQHGELSEGGLEGSFVNHVH